jgi:hypothetical protein
VFENRVLRRILESKRVEVMGGWRIVHDKKINDSYLSPGITNVNKSRKMRWAEKVARMGAMRNLYIKSKKPKIRDT